MLCLPLALRKSINSTETKILPITRQSKKLYYFSYLMNLINNIKKTWARINEVMNRNNLKSKSNYGCKGFELRRFGNNP